MTHQELWAAFRAACPDAGEEYEAWAYGDDPDKLAELTRAGIKTATASAGIWYERGEEPLPKAGEYSVILDSRDGAVCVVRTAKVYTVPFDQVSAGHAFREGEGDRSLAYWRKVHEDFFRAELAEAGLAFSPDMPVVCEEFEVVWPEPKVAALRQVKLTVTHSECRCGYHREGDAFLIGDLCPPLCHELWHTVYPSVYALLNGAELDCGAERTPQFDAKCPDGGRVRVHGEVINQSYFWR